jgi:hypothetical protein
VSKSGPVAKAAKRAVKAVSPAKKTRAAKK